jgi:hypothetical protein
MLFLIFGNTSNKLRKDVKIQIPKNDSSVDNKIPHSISNLLPIYEDTAPKKKEYRKGYLLL